MSPLTISQSPSPRLASIDHCVYPTFVPVHIESFDPFLPSYTLYIIIHHTYNHHASYHTLYIQGSVVPVIDVLAGVMVWWVFAMTSIVC